MYRQISHKQPNILGFKLQGNIAIKQQRQIGRILEKQIKKSGKIRLIIQMESRGSKDVESLLSDLNFAYAYSDNIERMVIIGDKSWEKTCVALFGLFAHIHSEYFDRSEAQAAWDWIQE
jgi:hypothetical protein